MEEVTLIQTETVPYLVILVLGLIWLTVLAIASRHSALPPRKRAAVNLLALVSGPVGWAVHLASYRQRLREARESRIETSALPSTVAMHKGNPEESPAAQPKKTSFRSLFDGLFQRRQEDRHGDSKAFNDLMQAAVAQGATDIHFEPHDDHYLGRVRVNGILRDYQRYSRERGDRLVAIAKVMASLDVVDKFKPQDGRLEWTNPADSMKLDIRIAVSPSLRGEKLALRFLNRPASAIDMTTLGMNESMQRALKRVVRHPEGFILMAGPTGSGKTSTAYSILTQLSGPSVNVMTIEDPVEYTVPYATQIAINPKLGITFQSGLATLLRQDPDIILIGEMREPESFRTGIRASLSGHLVISTMHARDSIQVFANLRNLGLETSSLAASVKLVVAQRLVRILCPECKIQDTELDEEAWDFLGGEATHIPVYQPGDGCPNCFQSGFIGRTGIFEYMTMDDTVKEWLEQDRHESDLRRALYEKNFRTMREDAREKVFGGSVWTQDAIRAAGIEIA